MTDFQVGDRLRMKGVPPGVADITVTDVGACEDQLGDDTTCGKPTVFFADPQSGEPDEGHADQFEKA